MDDYDLETIKWQFALLFNICGGQRTTENALCTKPQGYGTKHKGYGRCKYHAGCSTGPKTKEGKIASRRAQMLSKIKSGKYSKLSKDVLNEKEEKTYSVILKYFLENYNIEEYVADQLALLKVYQLFVLANEGDITITSEMMRKWAVEEKLTKKSQDQEKVTINLAQIIQNVHNEMEKAQKIESIDSESI